VSRFLFVVPPLSGHLNPAAAVHDALVALGHEVAWVGPEARLRPLIGPTTTVYPTGMRPYRGQLDQGMAALKSLWTGFVLPYARFILPAVDRAVLDYRPDLVVVDQHAPAGVLAAHRHGLRWATLAPQSMELTRPLRALPTVDAWVEEQLSALWAAAGLPAAGYVDPRWSPWLVVAFTTAALTGGYPLPEQVALVGPALGARPGPDFPWRWLDPRRGLVLVTVGTLAVDVATDFYARTVAALRPMGDRLRAVVVAPPELVPDPPAHVLVTPGVPMLDLMPHLDAVVCHGGLNTVCEALAFGVPLVVAPIKHDQPVNAAQVAAAGCGIRVSFTRVSPERLGSAVTAVLDDPAYRRAAEVVRGSFRLAGGAPAAAGLLARLAAPDAVTVHSGQSSLRSRTVHKGAPDDSD
jgi:UDP:flavonoid glycosyltransferase YjiC (YdhE family)